MAQRGQFSVANDSPPEPFRPADTVADVLRFGLVPDLVQPVHPIEAVNLHGSAAVDVVSR